jgi:hypothetical protein
MVNAPLRPAAADLEKIPAIGYSTRVMLYASDGTAA